MYSPVWLKAQCASFLGQEEIKPHKGALLSGTPRRREFEPKMAEVLRLCLHREVQVLKKAAAKAEKSNKPVAIVSLRREAWNQEPSPRRHRICRQCQAAMRASRGIMSTNADGTLSLLAGIDLLTGKVHALDTERNSRRECIEFLKLLHAAYPASTAIQADPRQSFRTHFEGNPEPAARHPAAGPLRLLPSFTPKHGSWLNLIEGFFSKFARAVLRHIRVTSKQELKERIMAGIDDVNRHPVIHTWSYNLAEAA